MRMSETTGLKCAPLTGPNSLMSTARIATVAPVFASNATPAFPAESRSAMTPEPMTVADKSSEPIASAANCRCTLFAGLGRSPTDPIELTLQFGNVGPGDRDSREQLDPGFEFPKGLAKGQCLFGSSPLCGGRVSNSPMSGDRLTRPYRADFACRVVADCENEIQPRRARRGKLVPTFAAQVLGGQAHPVQKLQRQRMDRSFWKAAGAEPSKLTVTPMVEQRLRKNAAG